MQKVKPALVWQWADKWAFSSILSSHIQRGSESFQSVLWLSDPWQCGFVYIAIVQKNLPFHVPPSEGRWASETSRETLHTLFFPFIPLFNQFKVSARVLEIKETHARTSLHSSPPSRPEGRDNNLHTEERRGSGENKYGLSTTLKNSFSCMQTSPQAAVWSRCFLQPRPAVWVLSGFQHSTALLHPE